MKERDPVSKETQVLGGPDQTSACMTHLEYAVNFRILVPLVSNRQIILHFDWYLK